MIDRPVASSTGRKCGAVRRIEREARIQEIVISGSRQIFDQRKEEVEVEVAREGVEAERAGTNAISRKRVCHCSFARTSAKGTIFGLLGQTDSAPVLTDCVCRRRDNVSRTSDGSRYVVAREKRDWSRGAPSTPCK
jgi:hypothetical protein